MTKNYTAIPHSYLEECEMLTDAEFGQLMRGLLRYCVDGTPIRAEGNARFFARRMMNQEDYNRIRYEEICRARSEAGKRGAAARWNGRSEDEDGNCQQKD